MKSKKMTGFIKIGTKILEVIHWLIVGLAALVALSFLSIMGEPRFLEAMDFAFENMDPSPLIFENFGVNISLPFDRADAAVLFLLIASLAVISVLRALIFRRLNRIFKMLDKISPFDESVVRSIRWVGILFLAIPTVSLVMTVIIRLVGGAGSVDIGINLEGYTIGLIILCLAQVFSRGAELEDDMDGLV